MANTRNPHQQRHYRALYDALGPASHQIHDYLKGLSDASLAQAVKMIDGLGTGNCAAMMYYGKTLFHEAVADEVHRRMQSRAV